MSEEKILDIKELAKICSNEKKKGKKIVMSYGCFDLLHPGHIRHLKAARQYGDILVVVIIPDRFVRKGPGRPVFNEHLRMESVASLSDVDYVTLNLWENPIKAIELLKPDFYVKGRDYSDNTMEVASIILEEKAIKKVGGEIRFTNEITFSSSSIINEQFDILPREAKEYIKQIKKKYRADEIIDILKNLEKLKVLIVGDVILDEYIFCKAIGKPEKAAVVSTQYIQSEMYNGGSLAVANHVAGFAKKVEIVSCIGNDGKEELILKNLKENIKTSFFHSKFVPTIIKTRYIEKTEGSKLFEISRLKDEFIDKDLEKSIVKYLREIKWQRAKYFLIYRILFIIIVTIL